MSVTDMAEIIVNNSPWWTSQCAQAYEEVVQGASSNTSKRMKKNSLTSWSTSQGVFKKVLSSFSAIIFANCEKYFFNFNP